MYTLNHEKSNNNLHTDPGKEGSQCTVHALTQERSDYNVHTDPGKE